VIPASQKFRDALPHSHTAMSRVIVMQPTAENTYKDTDSLEIVEGSLTLDGTRNIRRQGSFTLAPSYATDLTPLENITERSRIRLERGIKFIDGTEEWVVMAVLAVQNATMTLGQGTCQVTAYDPSSCIDDYGFITDYVPTRTSVEEIKHLVDDALWEHANWIVDPGIDTAVKPADGTVFSGSRWKAINTLASSLSAQVFCDNGGIWRLAKIDTTFDTIVDHLKSGADGVMIGGSSGKNRQNLFNAVVVAWDDPNGGGIVVVTDGDKESPTYWDGPFGKRPAPEQSNRTISSEKQALEVAAGLLAEHKGFRATVDFQTLHNPLLVPGDVVEIEISNVLHEIHVIDSINYSLTNGSMSCKTRAVRSVTSERV
jgi:hypothetical protein